MVHGKGDEFQCTKNGARNCCYGTPSKRTPLSVRMVERGFTLLSQNNGGKLVF